MSQDITLAGPRGGLPGGLDMFHGGALGAPAEPEVSPLKKVHRLLRGRYGLAIGLALGVGTLGAIIGWFSQSKKYESVGTIQIKPVVQAILSNEKVLPFYDKFVQSQPMVMTSQRVLEKALDNEYWRATGLSSSPSMLPGFKANLEAVYLKSTQLVTVTYTDERPAVAQAAVRAVVHAYTTLYDEVTGQRLKDTIEQIDAKRQSLEGAVSANRQQISFIAENYGTDDLKLLHTRKQEDVLNLETKLKAMKAQLDQIDGNKSNAEMTIEDIAGMDPAMRESLARIKNYQTQLDVWKAQGVGEKNIAYKKLADEMKVLQTNAETYAAAFREQFAAGGLIFDPDKLQFIPINPKVVDALRQAYQVRTAEMKTAMEERDKVGQAQVKIKLLTDAVNEARDQLVGVNRKYEEKVAEASGTGTLQVISDGDYPVQSTDNRKKMAFVGFVLGAALPIGVLLLIGVLDGRYRYSEEAGDDMAGMMLLGILPNLPDRLTDPDQAATAAHCVHQIRTMLQINGGDERRVYCVTSASPGDGKTSLTLALGLSFAASGQRTLLIDCDLVGAGLTARLDMGGPEGILEAMSNRALLEYIRTTDVPDLAMLPVGTAQPHHAGMFSPAAMKRLVNEARKHFEVVLIDTGPILGSIEATPVCAASDGVILTVSRGQHRPLVEKAMAHLQSIGAKFAGVVFNRAQHRDFEKSVSGMSLRSVTRSSQSGYNSRRPSNQEQTLGPVAKAVASSFKPPES